MTAARADLAVSIIVPTYNAAAFLEDALQSVRDQTLGDFECLVIDDGSTDASVELAQAFAERDKRFRSIVMPAKGGVSAARNQGLVEARGDWVALLDADDLFVEDRLEILTELGRLKKGDIIFDDQIITDFPAAYSARRAFGFRDTCFDFSQEDFFEGARLFRTAFPTGYMKPLIRRELLRESGARYDVEVHSGEDFLFYTALFAARPRCIGASFAGYVYRRRQGSLSWSEAHLHQQAELSDRILAAHGDRLSPQSRAALVGRLRDFQQIADVLPAMRALRQRDWGGFVRSVISRPSIIGTMIKRIRTRSLRSLRSFVRGA